jgi:hypothetical protein
MNLCTIRGWLAYGVRRTVVRIYQLNMHAETELRIQVKELLFDDAYLSKVIENT